MGLNEEERQIIVKLEFMDNLWQFTFTNKMQANRRYQ